jgi:hypothetical protein
VTGSQPAVAHLFIATPFNAGYLDPGGRWATDRPATTGPGRSGELVGALSALTSLGGGAPIGDLLRAAGRVAAAAEAVFGPSTPTDDNEIFAAICAGLAGTGPTTRPPFKGTGLACRMSSGPASVLDVTASTERYTSPPDDHLELRSTSFDGQWAGGTYQGDHLRFRRGPQPGPYGH